jgi:hypothetical protein
LLLHDDAVRLIVKSMPDNTIKAQTKKLRRNLRKLLERALDRVETQTEGAFAYARKLVARINPARRRAA